MVELQFVLCSPKGYSLAVDYEQVGLPRKRFNERYLELNGSKVQYQHSVFGFSKVMLFAVEKWNMENIKELLSLMDYEISKETFEIISVKAFHSKKFSSLAVQNAILDMIPNCVTSIAIESLGEYEIGIVILLKTSHQDLAHTLQTN
jgi:hypothetical protein